MNPCQSYRQNPATSVLSPPSHDIREYWIVYVYTPDEAGIRLGMNILNALPSQDLCERLLGHYFVFDDTVSHKPTIIFAHKSLSGIYGTYLMKPRGPAKLSLVSEKLCRNAFCQSGNDTHKNRHTWLASFTSDHFRWEISGVPVAIFGLGAISLPAWDPLLAAQDQSRNDRRKFACGMRELVEAFLTLCGHADNFSDLAVYLLVFSGFIFTMYGAPSAGVFCVKLLKAKKPSLDNTVVLTPSKVMQKLRIFISCLDWTRPTDETYTL